MRDLTTISRCAPVCGGFLVAASARRSGCRHQETATNRHRNGSIKRRSILDLLLHDAPSKFARCQGAQGRGDHATRVRVATLRDRHCAERRIRGPLPPPSTSARRAPTPVARQQHHRSENSLFSLLTATTGFFSTSTSCSAGEGADAAPLGPTFPETQAMRDARGYVASDIQDAVAEEIGMRSGSSPPPTSPTTNMNSARSPLRQSVGRTAPDTALEATALVLQEEKWLKLQAMLKNLSTIRHCRTIDADDGRWIEADDFGIALELCQINADAAPVRRLTQLCSSADGRVDFQQFLVLSRGPEPEPEPAHPLSKLGKLGKLGGKQKDKWQRRDVEVSIEGGIRWSSGSVLRDIVSATWSGSQQLSPAQIVSVSHRADIDVNARRTYVFQVVSRVKAGKVYKFKAESEAESEAWIEAIQNCIDAHIGDRPDRATSATGTSFTRRVCQEVGCLVVAHFGPIVGPALVLIGRIFIAVQDQSARDYLQAQLQLLSRQIDDVRTAAIEP